MWPLHCTVILLDVTVNTDKVMSEGEEGCIQKDVEVLFSYFVSKKIPGVNKICIFVL